jgi:hypothetical protein
MASDGDLNGVCAVFVLYSFGVMKAKLGRYSLVALYIFCGFNTNKCLLL